MILRDKTIMIGDRQAEAVYVGDRKVWPRYIDPSILYRVNCGGPRLLAIDDGPDWAQDSRVTNSIYLVDAASNQTFFGNVDVFTEDIDLSKVPADLFSSERYNTFTYADIKYSFPVEIASTYEVRIYAGDSFSGTADPGSRVFSIRIEGSIPTIFEDIDLSAMFGNQVGGLLTFAVEMMDDALDIDLVHNNIQNPLINGIEIVKV